MFRKLNLLNICILVIIFLSGCQLVNSTSSDERSELRPNETGDDTVVSTENTFNVVIGNVTYTADFFDTETAKVFREHLPLVLEMNELNGNEKYNYLDYNLPNSDEVSGDIHAGDIMLYNSNCIVLFYEDFHTDYSYSRIGQIQDPTGLKDVVGNGNVQVTFN